MSDIITGTPAGLTYEHALVQEAWLTVWIITSAALALIIGWIGLSLIAEEPLGGRGSSWRELIPRLLLGLVAAAVSLWWCAVVIDAVVNPVVNVDTPPDPSGGSSGDGAPPADGG